MKFNFLNPGFVKIAQRNKDHVNIIDTSGDIWIFYDGGSKREINWKSLNLCNDYLTELFQGFIFHRLEMFAPITVWANYLSIRLLSKSNLNSEFPWRENDVLNFINSLKFVREKNDFYQFYLWGFNNGLTGFEKNIQVKIREHNQGHRPVHNKKILLRQAGITAEQEILLLNYIEESYSTKDYHLLRDNIIIHLAFQLAPRPIQLHSLEKTDFVVVPSAATSYYSLNLPMAKKIRSRLPERRPRSIDSNLGKKIEQLITLDREKFKINNNSALFKHEDGSRLASWRVSEIIIDQLAKLGIKGGLTTMRHHLAQSIADMGGSAELIAEILGHNSLVAARAYVAASPGISVIKTKALGKNQTYLNILKMLVTGEITDRVESPKDRWVKGIVGKQYIGGIGACGLSSNTSCPKNPVYSCYTCKKFHPFVDGSHEVVKKALEEQAQSFVDVAINNMDIETNRSVTQLELTIQAVQGVIENLKLKNHN